MDANAAGRLLSRRWFRRPPKVRVGGAGSGSLPYLELVWMPAYVIEYRTQAGTEVLCLVEGMSGVASVRQPESVSFDRLDASESFAPVLSESAARDLARETLLRGTLYRRRKSGFSFGEPMACGLVHYPYWVYYYRRRALIDIRVLDAVTGERAGQKIKLGILDAFQRKSRAEQEVHG